MTNKFVLDDSSVFTIGSDAITCATEVSFDESADVYFAQCGGASGSGVKEPVVGTKQVTGTITAELTNADVTVANYLAPGDSGTLTFYPQGNVASNIKISATLLTVTGRQLRFGSNGLATITAPFVLDSFVIAAASG